MRSKIFRQVGQKIEVRLTPCRDFFGQTDGIIFKQGVRHELCGVAPSSIRHKFLSVSTSDHSRRLKFQILTAKPVDFLKLSLYNKSAFCVGFRQFNYQRPGDPFGLPGLLLSVELMIDNKMATMPACSQLCKQAGKIYDAIGIC